MMAQRAWSLGSDLAGVGTAMITSGAVPALLPAHIGVSQISQMITTQDFADPLGASTPAVNRYVPCLRLFAFGSGRSERGAGGGGASGTSASGAWPSCAGRTAWPESR